MASAGAVPEEVVLRAQALLQAGLEAAQAHRDALLGGLALLALLAAARLVVGCARFVHSYFLRAPIHPRTFGPWAVVTGASDGIGRAISNQLAEKGERAAPCPGWLAAPGRWAAAAWHAHPVVSGRLLHPHAAPAPPSKQV